MLTKVFIKLYEMHVPTECLIKLLLPLSTNENRSSDLSFVPQRPLRSPEGDTATLELMPVLKNWSKFLSGDRAKTQTSASPILKSLQTVD